MVVQLPEASGTADGLTRVPAARLAKATPQVVIVGAGFGGLWAASALARAPAQVTVIDERNYHLFQPLLYQVATAGLSPADIATPIRGVLSRQKNARVLLGRVVGVDKKRRLVALRDREVAYDYLIVATGARHAYFGHDEWAAFAPGLKNIDDATKLRRKILTALERAEQETDSAKQRELMTFVVVGGGATGVETAGAIAELVKVALARDFRAINPAMSRIVLIEAGPRILPSFDPGLAAAAQRALARHGVEVRLGKAVTRCDASGVALGQEAIACGTTIWAAGVVASPAAQWLAADHDRAGRVIVGADLSLPGHPEIFVIGDTALVRDGAGEPLAGTATVAKQEGKYVARSLRAHLSGTTAPPAFHYRDYGELATVGRNFAVVDFRWIKLTGRIAWLVWSVAHIYFLIGFRNRLVVAMNWIWAYLTFQRGARLITAGESED
jgi:NADH dehydrogenase